MLTFDMSLSGGQVGRALAHDEEETYEMLVGLAGVVGDRAGEFAQEVAFFSSDARKLKAVANLLRTMADAIDPTE